MDNSFLNIAHGLDLKTWAREYGSGTLQASIYAGEGNKAIENPGTLWRTFAREERAAFAFGYHFEIAGKEEIKIGELLTEGDCSTTTEAMQLITMAETMPHLAVFNPALQHVTVERSECKPVSGPAIVLDKSQNPDWIGKDRLVYCLISELQKGIRENSGHKHDDEYDPHVQSSMRLLRKGYAQAPQYDHQGNPEKLEAAFVQASARVDEINKMPQDEWIALYSPGTLTRPSRAGIDISEPYLNARAILCFGNNFHVARKGNLEFWEGMKMTREIHEKPDGVKELKYPAIFTEGPWHTEVFNAVHKQAGCSASFTGITENDADRDQITSIGLRIKFEDETRPAWLPQGYEVISPLSKRIPKTSKSSGEITGVQWSAPLSPCF